MYYVHVLLLLCYYNYYICDRNERTRNVCEHVIRLNMYVRQKRRQIPGSFAQVFEGVYVHVTYYRTKYRKEQKLEDFLERSLKKVKGAKTHGESRGEL